MMYVLYHLNARIILRTNDESDPRCNYKNQRHKLAPGDAAITAIMLCAGVLQGLKCQRVPVVKAGPELIAREFLTCLFCERLYSSKRKKLSKLRVSCSKVIMYVSSNKGGN